jgi:hypothetical protein
MRFICPQIYFHGKDLSSLHSFISPEILPAEYGGTKPSFDNRTWRLSLLANEDKFVGEYTPSLPPPGPTHTALSSRFLLVPTTLIIMLAGAQSAGRAIHG